MKAIKAQIENKCSVPYNILQMKASSKNNMAKKIMYAKRMESIPIIRVFLPH